MLIFALPLADEAFSVGRRLRASPAGLAGLRAVLAADRRHLHHRLIETGLSTRSAVLALYALAIGLSLVALHAARESSERLSEPRSVPASPGGMGGALRGPHIGQCQSIRR
jgi:hypothetical protein